MRAGGGASPSNSTLNATASDCVSFEICPGLIDSESPVPPLWASSGRPQRGPWTRGNSTKNSTAIGIACSRIVPAVRKRRAIGCSRVPNCIVSIEVSSPSTASTARAPVSIDWEWKNAVSRRKKQRKITTKRSRRTLISISLSPRKRTSSATPGSRPSSVP